MPKKKAKNKQLAAANAKKAREVPAPQQRPMYNQGRREQYITPVLKRSKGRKGKQVSICSLLNNWTIISVEK